MNLNWKDRSSLEKELSQPGQIPGPAFSSFRYLRGATSLLYGYGVCPGDPESTSSPAETSKPKPVSGVEQATGAGLRSEASEEMIETSSSGHSRGHGGSRRASGGEDSGDDDMYSLMRSIEINEIDRSSNKILPRF